MSQILSCVRRDITDFPRVDAALSTNLGAVPFRRPLSDGRANTRGFFRPLPASLRRPLLLASCALFRSFVRLICHLVGGGAVHHAPEMHHFIESAQKIRCLKRSSSGYSSAGVLTFRWPFAQEI